MGTIVSPGKKGTTGVPCISKAEAQLWQSEPQSRSSNHTMKGILKASSPRRMYEYIGIAKRVEDLWLRV